MFATWAEEECLVFLLTFLAESGESLGDSRHLISGPFRLQRLDLQQKLGALATTRPLLLDCRTHVRYPGLQNDKRRLLAPGKIERSNDTQEEYFDDYIVACRRMSDCCELCPCHVAVFFKLTVVASLVISFVVGVYHSKGVITTVLSILSY